MLDAEDELSQGGLLLAVVVTVGFSSMKSSGGGGRGGEGELGGSSVGKGGEM